ncbi:MAG: hypothetical protein KAG66_15795, partial [Methylococcales bacterium]|nr:hypothetical protein [Methylococcales bacterium]
YRVVQHTFYAYADGDEAVIVQPAANSIHAAGEVQVHGALPLPAGSLVDIAIALPDGAELNPVSAELLDNHTFTVTLSTAGLSGPIKILVINPSDGTLLISRPITLK